MNKEIKEILDYYKKEIEKDELFMKDYTEEQLKTTFQKKYQRYRNHKLLLDYITNLEQELDLVKNKLIEEHSKNFNAIEFIKEKISSTKGIINDYMYHKEHNKHLIELLKEDIDMYNKELDILTGGDEE